MRQETLKRFGIKVKMLRNLKGLSQEQLADLSDLDRTYISLIERGRRNPSLVNIAKIALGLKVPIEQVVKGVVR
jgi:transcriptional regulator with XRE-family HTH domain